MIAISFALPAESAGFCRRLKVEDRSVRDAAPILFGRIDNLEVVICHTGVGRKVCEPRIKTFLQREKPRLLISAGFAGSLRDDLKAADLIFGANFSDSDLLLSAQEILQSHLPRATKLFTGDRIVDSREERHELALQTGAAALDMETKYIAAECAKRSVRLLSMRIISDSVDEPFPAPPRVLFDIEKQRTSALVLGKYLLTNPGAILRLRRFALQISRARAKLTEALLTVLPGLSA